MRPIKGGKVTTNNENQELLTKDRILKKVTIHNKSNKEITVIINNGSKIPLGADESITLGNLKITSIIIVEKGSTVRYIGVGI